MSDDQDDVDDFESWQRDADNIHLNLDQALLKFSNGADKQLYLFKQYKECYKVFVIKFPWSIFNKRYQCRYFALIISELSANFQLDTLR